MIKEQRANTIKWPSPNRLPALRSGHIHVWCVDLNLDQNRLATLSAYLTQAEKIRAARYVQQVHQQHFTAARGYLRELLALYLSLHPAEIEFSYGSHGKPGVANAEGKRLYFNASDSHGLVLYAVTLDTEVGVDIEWVKREVEAIELAQRFFSHAESEQLNRLSEAQIEQGFFNCWTRKEAFIKAVGEGLSYPLEQFEVSLAPTEAPIIRNIKGSLREAQHWSLYAFNPAPDFVGALAIKRKTNQLHYFRYPSVFNY